MRGELDRDKIVNEAVGERPASTIPQAARDRVPEGVPAASVGPHASIPAKTAEAMGERESGAYADPSKGSNGAHLWRRRSPQRTWSRMQSSSGPMVMVGATAFALGYAAALLLHSRR